MARSCRNDRKHDSRLIRQAIAKWPTMAKPDLIAIDLNDDAVLWIVSGWNRTKVVLSAPITEDELRKLYRNLVRHNLISDAYQEQFL